MAEERYYAAIDKDVLIEIFEYLVKTKLNNIGRFNLGEVFKDGDNFFAEIRGEDSEKVRKLYSKIFLGEFRVDSTYEAYSVVASIKGREKQPPEESFRLSRKIGKVMEKEIFRKEKVKVSTKPIPKKKRVFSEEADKI